MWIIPELSIAITSDAPSIYTGLLPELKEGLDDKFAFRFRFEYRQTIDESTVVYVFKTID